MIDYTDKESLKQFLKENDIRDSVQLYLPPKTLMLKVKWKMVSYT